MATTQDRIKRLEEKIDAIFAILDADKEKEAAKDIKDAIDIGVKKVNDEKEEKKAASRDKWAKILWAPIILLLVSAVLSWLTKCGQIQLGG